MTTIEEQLDGSDDVRERLARTEATLEAIRAREAGDFRRLAEPGVPVIRSVFASAALERQEQTRRARVRIATEAAEAARLQAVKDRPKQEKRDAALAALTERISGMDREDAALQRKRGEARAEYAHLAGRPL